MKKCKKAKNIKNIDRVLKYKKALNFGKVFQERGLIRRVSFAELILTIVIIFLIFPVNILATLWDVSTAVYDDKYKDTTSQDTEVYDVFLSPDGSKMYIAGNLNDKVFQYSLSTPWDVSTATYNDKYIWIHYTVDTFIRGVAFSPDGSKMYIMGYVNNKVFQYSLSTPWDVSTATYDDKYKDVSSQDGDCLDMSFNPDGSKMYVAGELSRKVFQYSLSTPWDVSTATYDNKYKNVYTQSPYLYGLDFSSDGSKMYVVNHMADTIFQYSLSTPWDVSTATYNDKYKNVTSEASVPYAFTFSSDGRKMYVNDAVTDTVYQYTLPDVEAPTVTIQAVSDIEATTATGNGNITNTGGEDCDKRGFVYGTTTQSDPGNTTPASSGYDSYAEDTDGFGPVAFTKGLTGLTPGTKYYIRAYAHNSAGYNYSDTELDFTTNAANTAPTVDSVSIDSDAVSITLNEGTTTDVICTYNAADTNGWTDITTTTAKLYLTSVGAGAADDNDNHYTLSGARDDYCTSTGANTGNCTTTFSVYYYANPGEWTCQATVFDSQSASSTATDTITMSETQYLDVSTTTLDYDEVGVGSTSTGNHIITVSNTGNTAIDVKISGTDMSCTTHGSIPVANQEYAESSFSHGEGTALSGTPTGWNLDLPKPTSSTSTVEADTYWQISVPTGTEGTCTGTNTFEARTAL